MDSVICEIVFELSKFVNEVYFTGDDFVNNQRRKKCITYILPRNSSSESLYTLFLFLA